VSLTPWWDGVSGCHQRSPTWNM